MARFTLGTTGAASINSGIGGLFRALAQAPYLREQAEQQAALKGAQAYSATASGDKHAAEAESERYTLGQRQGVDELIAGDPALESFRRNQLLAFKLAGPQYMDDFSKSGQTEQTIQAIQDIQKNPALATATAQAYGATSGRGPYSAVATTGRSINELTGEGRILDAALAKLFSDKVQSEIGENAAQAKNALESAGQHKASAAKTNLETEALRDLDTTGPLSGKPLTNAQRRTNADIDVARKFVEGVPNSRVRSVMNKSEFDLTPADKDLLARIKKARTAKYGEATVPEGINQLLGLDPAIVASTVNQLTTPKTKSTLFGFGSDRPMTEEEVIADIKNSLPATEQTALDDYIAAARARMSGVPTAAPAPAAAPAKVESVLRKPDPILAKLPPGSRQIGTSKGRPVYQAPNGKKFIVE